MGELFQLGGTILEQTGQLSFEEISGVIVGLLGKGTLSFSAHSP